MDEIEQARERVIAFLDLMDSWPGKPGYADEIYSLNETPLSRSDIRAAIEQSAAHDRVVAANAWDEGWTAAQVVEELEGQKVWAHTVIEEGYEPNPYRITEENK